MGLSDLEPNLRSRIKRSGECWLWTGGHSWYGAIRIGRKVLRVHRVVYELLVGPIPAGLVLDHLCENKLCVNPDHLEPVTQSENMRRAHRPREPIRTDSSTIRRIEMLIDSHRLRLGMPAIKR